MSTAGFRRMSLYQDIRKNEIAFQGRPMNDFHRQEADALWSLPLARLPSFMLIADSLRN
jgi:hypothetical protein